MDTPITISSTLSSVEKSHKRITLPHSESSIARVPVSWDSPSKLWDRETSCTPSTLQKVNNWINSLKRLNRDNVDRNIGSHRQSSDFSDFDLQNELNIDHEGDLIGNQIIMSDYNKTELKGQRAEDEFDKQCISPYDYTKVSQSTSKSPEETMFGGGPKKHRHPKAVKRRKSQNYGLYEKDDDKSDDYDSDEPLSPESEKKKELCSYLQLMKPTDKKTVMILQNRRSVRVKNLSLMQEKRELEKKMREANTENENEYDHSDNVGLEQEYPGLKSFDQMNVDLDKKKYQWLKYTGAKSSVDLFFFPKPSDSLKQVINDFDDVKNCWFEKVKDESCEKQPDISIDFNIKPSLVTSKNQLKEEKEGCKKNGIDTFHNNKRENKKETVKLKPKINTVSEYIRFKKRKSEAVKNDLNTTPPTNGEVKKKIELQTSKMAEVNKIKTKKINSNRLGNINANKKKKEETNRTNNKSQSHLDTNHVEKIRPQNSNSTDEKQLMIPKPSICLVRDLKDFDIVIEQNKNLIKNNSLPSCPPKVEINKPRGKLVDNAETLLPFSTTKVESKKTTEKRKLLVTSKSKVHSLKKKIKAKRLSTERNVRRSSFKIKLKPKRKSLGSQVKLDKKLTNSKSSLISDIMKSLRTRSIETPTSEISSLKNKKIKKKENVMNKKENKKQKLRKPKIPERIIKPKNSESNLEVVLKAPLKDTNKNPVENMISSSKSPVKDKNYKAIIDDPKLPTNDKISQNNNSLHELISDVDFGNLSSEHKTSLLVKDTNQRDIGADMPIIAIYHKNSADGLDNNSREKTKEKSEFYSQILNIEKYPEGNPTDVVNNQSSLLEIRKENDSDLYSISKRCSTPISSKEKSIKNSCQIPQAIVDAPPFITLKKDAAVKTLHKCLNIPTPKSVATNLEKSPTSWSSESPSHKRKRNEHSINIFKEHGSVLKAFYLDYNLVLCQEFNVSFWNQSPLGNVLGSQTMWFDVGSVPRISMNNNCIFKESLDMVVYTVSTVAYIELWIKEHQSDIREGPVADVFAAVYFWKKGQNGLDKKVLQLENINGFADDVQYSVFKSSARIVVSWHLACSELESKKTNIHCYQLTPDYQTVCNISEYEAVEHYVSSLHNIEGCDSFIMGCGENKITLWNIDSGYVVTTIEMSEIKSPLSTLWVKCDRGFIFTLQQCVDRELRLIAIHAINYTWKKLASYVPPDEYDRLKGVCVENGIVLGFYDQGILCWNAEKAETVLEEAHNDAEFISGKYVISVVNNKVILKHAITHLISACSC